MDFILATDDMNDYLNIQRTDKLLTITLNRPDRRNALTLDMLNSLAKEVETAAAADLVILQGEGSAFCGGFDVTLLKESTAMIDDLIAALSQACRAMRRCPATVLVDVQGAAVAGGCALAVSADIVVARHGAQFGYPVHKLGISPAVTIPTLLPALGGAARALLMSGQLQSAESLYEMGLVHHLMKPTSSIEGMTSALLNRGSHASKMTKMWLNELEGVMQDNRFDGPVEGSKGLQFHQP